MNGKRTRPPITIIKYGPPASGKGSTFVKKKIREILNTNQNIPTQINANGKITFIKSYTNSYGNTRQLVNINMNKPIESNPEYIEATTKQKTQLQTEYGKNLYLNKLTTKNTEKMYNLYSKYAQSIYQLATNELKGANKNGADVIIETTGQRGLPDWLEINEYRKYHIIFPIIPFETLWKRYKNRANTGKVFRILSTKEQLREVYIKSYNEFLNNYLGNKKFTVYVLYNEGKEVEFLNPNSVNTKTLINDMITQATSNRRNNTEK